MSTLHHGLLVDPNSSKEIADALVKILTEPKEWEEMSNNGIKNIMAYSWPSHCKQVLESLEKEKQYTKTHTVRSHHVKDFKLILVGLLYKAYPNGCQHRLQVLLRLRPYPMRGHQLLYHVNPLQLQVAYEQALESLEEEKQHTKAHIHIALTVSDRNSISLLCTIGL